jgi:fatty acid synthase subunit beta
MQTAIFEDIRSKGVYPESAAFAGHSLGEFSALSCVGGVLEIETLMDIVFYRGMTMQKMVARDEYGRSTFGMCAVNPARVHPAFDESALIQVVEGIEKLHPGSLLQVVNYNASSIRSI